MVSRRPTAAVKLIELPDVASGAIRVEVECAGSATGITYMPSAAEFDVPALTTFAIYEHEARCEAGCDTSEAHRQGDQRTRAQIEQLAVTRRATQSKRRARGRRN